MHKMHMCALAATDNAELMEHLADHPTVECRNCGALANDARNVCNPRPLADTA
jgi:predicted nucleic acid-binding Zn ribbon protein